MYYSAISILALLVLLIENQGILFKRREDFKHPTWISYRKFLLSVLAYYVTDILWGIIELNKLPILLFIDTSLYFVAMALGVMCWTEYIVKCLEDSSRLKGFLLWVGRVFAGVVTLLVIINAFVPVLFTVDKNCVYSATSGRYVILIIQIITLLFVAAYAMYFIISKRTKEIRKYRTLAFFSFIMGVFMTAQLWYPYLPLYAIAYLLGLTLLHTYVIIDEKEIYKHEMEEAQKISTLRQSINSLLDNMPVNSYSKDVETGVYLACNQSFAEYTHKGSPEDVVGLTDFEMFDRETAEHFTKVDKIALESDKPYVVYEVVSDVDGNPRHFQTTKLKFYDDTGRLCLLGMSMDITEMVKAKKENELTKAAYLEAINASTIYENIVGMLSKDYFDLYYINVETEEYVEYGSKTEMGSNSVEHRGSNFFESIKADVYDLIYEEDREKLLEAVDKSALIKEIDEQGVFLYYYRLIIDGKPNFVCLKATRVSGDKNHIIIGISNVDAQMQSRIDIENAKKEKKAYERLSAFSRNLMVLFVVDPETEEYTQYSSSDDFERLGISKKGKKFFEETFQNSLSAIYEEDQGMFHYLFTKEHILRAIELDGIFVMDYRLMIDGKPNYVRLKASEVEEDEKTLLIFGLENVDLNVRREQQQAYELTIAREMATKDALTGVKNGHAFSQEKSHLNEYITKGQADDFAIVICDINGLKNVNDTLGHQSGDEFIRKACATICDIFKHSKVFRIGGDEFAVVCHGHDYEMIDDLLRQMDAANSNIGEVQISYGMARYNGESNVEELIERADKNMYKYKEAIKAKKAVNGSEIADAPVLYEFPEDLKKAYESSPLSFVYYQNIKHRAVPILASNGFCRNVGMARDVVLEWLSNGMFERMHPDDVGVMSQISDDFLHQRGPYDTVFRCRVPRVEARETERKEEYVYIHAFGKWQTMPDGTELAVITYSNLSEAQKKTVEKLQMYLKIRKDRFYTDPLTDIPNINYLNEFGAEKIRIIRAGKKMPKAIYIDIYSMQSYNNQYGIEEGDRLLCLTARTLNEVFADSLVARAVDDHFVIITDADENGELQTKLHRVNHVVRKKAFGNTSGIRSGVSLIDEKTSLSEAVDHAKMALKNIENNMNREVEFFSQDSNDLYLQDRYIIENFSRALKNDYIKVYLHSLRRVESQKIAAFESLARWVDPERGTFRPTTFIPVLIKYHQLYKLDLYMFEQVCKLAKHCAENGLPLTPVSINFSRQDFDHVDVVEEMNRLYDKYELNGLVDKNYFIVEITEQDLAMGEESFKEQLKKIRENNYRLWLDDFGSGYSAISMFSQYDFDLIKFDMDLLIHLDDNGSVNRLILEELVRLCRRLGIHTLAEGLETEEHMAFIRQIGCELAQGFYYNKPEEVDVVLGRITASDEKWQCETPEEREEFRRKWFEEP